MSGGKLKVQGAPGQQMAPGEALEVQKFIPVQDTAKMKEMEE